jgi:hypothetical protein
VAQQLETGENDATWLEGMDGVIHPAGKLLDDERWMRELHVNISLPAGNLYIAS